MIERSSREYRDLFQDALDNGRVYRLRPFLPCRNAKNLEELRHIAETIVRMTDEELDRLRDHLTPPGQGGHGTGGYSYAHPPPEWMDGITRHLLGVPAKMTGPQA